MRAFSSCIDCLDRHVGCHAECEKYQKEKADYERVKAKRDRENLYDGYARARVSSFNEKTAKNPRYFKK